LDKLNARIAVSNIEIESEFIVIISWPDPALRYVFLHEQYQTEFREMLSKIQMENPFVQVEMPIRDKKNVLAAMRFSGPEQDVLPMKEQVENILEEYKRRLYQFSFLVSASQLNMLRSTNFNRIKSIQRRFGVFINASGERCDIRRENDYGGVDARLIAKGRVIEEEHLRFKEIGTDTSSQTYTTSVLEMIAPRKFCDLDIIGYVELEQV
jgi:hypothetical protein